MLSTTQTENNQTQLTAGYDLYHTKLKLYANSRMHNHEVSEDLVQDAFKKTWIYLVKGGKIHLMEAFLYHVLRGLIVDVYRKKKAVSLEVLLEKGFEPGTDDTERSVNVFDGKIAILLIQNLPLQYRKLMYMKYVQDLTLTEIALLTGKTKNTVAVQTHRGLEKLKVLYHNTK